jgi:hypothetical protein
VRCPAAVAPLPVAAAVQLSFTASPLLTLAALPKGPELPDKSTVQEGQPHGGQPGLQRDMQAQPVSGQLPTQHGTSGFWGVGTDGRGSGHVLMGGPAVMLARH